MDDNDQQREIMIEMRIWKETTDQRLLALEGTVRNQNKQINGWVQQIDRRVEDLQRMFSRFIWTASGATVMGGLLWLIIVNWQAIRPVITGL